MFFRIFPFTFVVRSLMSGYPVLRRFALSGPEQLEHDQVRRVGFRWALVGRVRRICT